MFIVYNTSALIEEYLHEPFFFFFLFFLPVKEERIRVIYEREQYYVLTHHYIGQTALE